MKKISISKQKEQVVTLYGSSVIGLIVGVLVSVLNTRSLTPELYGDVRYVQNLISFISSLLLVGFFVSGSRLLAISKNEAYSRKIRGIMCVILAATICVVMVCMTVMYLVNGTNGTENMAILYLAAIPVCGNVLMLNYVNTTAQGDNHIGRISLARLLPSCIYLVAAFLIFKYFGATPVRMLLLYNGIAILVLLGIIYSTKPDFSDLRNSFKILGEENKKYGFNVYIGSLVDNSTQYLAGIMIGYYCANNANVGFYTLALTLASPLAMLPGIIGTTYFKRFAAQSYIDKKVFLASILLSLASLVVFVVCIDFVVGLLYEDSYSSVSTYAIYLAIGTCFHGFGDMINRFLGSHGKGKELRNAAFANGIFSIFGYIILVYYLGINGAIITKVGSCIIYAIVLMYYYFNFAHSTHIQ